MARSTTVFRARTRGFKSLVRDLEESQKTMVSDQRKALARIEPKLEATYRRFAPVESGRMRDSIFTALYTAPGGAVQVRVGIASTKDPVTGYDYLEQSRAGRGEVRVRTAGRLVLSLNRSKAGLAGTRVPVGQVVRGWRPAVDWVAAAERRARRHVTEAQRETTRAISRHGVLRSHGGTSA